MLRELFKSIGTYRTALRYMTKRRLWTWQLIPGLISLLFGSALIWAAFSFSDNIAGWLTGLYPWEWGREVIATVLTWLSGLLIIVSGLFIFRYTLLIILGPMLSALSEKVEQIYINDPSHKLPGFSLRRMIRDVRRGLRLTFRNMFKELATTLVLTVIGFVPALSPFATPAIFAIQSYYAGFGNMDFTMERYMNVSERVAFVRRHKGLALGNGLVFMLLLFIPVIGLFIAPTLAIIASTIDVLDALKHEDAIV